MTNLRDRIAAVLLAHPDEWNTSHQEWADQVADEIIAHLGLTPETGYGTTTYPQVPVVDRRLVRYVTDWSVADE